MAWLSCAPGYPFSGFAGKLPFSWVEPNPVLPLTVPQFCAVSSVARSLRHGLKPAVVAKFKLLFPAAPKFVLRSEAPREEGDGGTVGRSLVQPAPFCTGFHAEVSVCSQVFSRSEGGSPGVSAAHLPSASRGGAGASPCPAKCTASTLKSRGLASSARLHGR